MEGHVLPVPAIVNNLILAASALSGVPLHLVKDPHSGEPSWPLIRTVRGNSPSLIVPAHIFVGLTISRHSYDFSLTQTFPPSLISTECAEPPP
jgi:hypothetical protein